MALSRTTRSVDGTIPVPALLYNDEEIYASQDGVGIYDGTQKSPNHQAGTIVVSTHRLFYIDSRNAYKYSFSLDLSYITQTEYYAGLFKSSPKVTLHISGNSTTLGQGITDDSEVGFESWECEVCAYRNPPGLSPAAARVCSLCGVPRSSVLSSAASVTSQHLSSSLPSSTASLALSSSSSLTAPPPHENGSSSIACPACTFLNHPFLRSCEMCSTGLPRLPHQPQRALKSAPSSRPSSPETDDEDPTATRIIKVSFRKGGDKAFYSMLKRSLKGKMWESNGIGTSTRGSDPGLLSDRNTVGRSGITGILRTVESEAQGRETGMLDALQDLQALMVKAKDMVRLAAELNEKLTAASTAGNSQSSPTLVSPAEPEEATFIRSSLSQLGLQMANAPVTLDMMKDERLWIEELARELAQILQGSFSPSKERGMMKDRGVVALDEVWGGWNRARGVGKFTRVYLKSL